MRENGDSGRLQISINFLSSEEVLPIFIEEEIDSFHINVKMPIQKLYGVKFYIIH